MSTRQKLLEEIEAFLKETGMAPTVFGEEAVGDRALIISLRKGRDLKLATMDRIRAFMAAKRAKRKPRPSGSSKRAPIEANAA